MFLKREKIPYVDEPFVTKRNLEENIIESIRTLVAPFTEIPSVTGLHDRKIHILSQKYRGSRAGFMAG